MYQHTLTLMGVHSRPTMRNGGASLQKLFHLLICYTHPRAAIDERRFFGFFRNRLVFVYSRCASSLTMFLECMYYPFSLTNFIVHTTTHRIQHYLLYYNAQRITAFHIKKHSVHRPISSPSHSHMEQGHSKVNL